MRGEDNLYIQCVRGKANWQSCDPIFYIYNDKCKKCLDPRSFTGNCQTKLPSLYCNAVDRLIVTINGFLFGISDF